MAYTSVNDVKQYLGITKTGDDTLISDLIDRAQTAIESYTQRVFEAGADAVRYFTVGEDTEGSVLYLTEDLISITTIKTDADATSPVTLTADTDYITHPRNTTPYHAIKLLSTSSYTWTYADDPEFGVEVNGKWAYSTTPPNDIIHACVRLVGYYYRQKDSQVFDVTAIPEAGVITVPVGIPVDVKKILDLYRRKVYI